MCLDPDPGPLRVLVITGEFPVLSQTFITNKVAALARSGVAVTVMALSRGDRALLRLLQAEWPRNLEVCFAPERDSASRAALRLPGIILGALSRSPRGLVKLLRLLSRRHRSGGGGSPADSIDCCPSSAVLPT